MDHLTVYYQTGSPQSLIVTEATAEAASRLRSLTLGQYCVGAHVFLQLGPFQEALGAQRAIKAPVSRVAAHMLVQAGRICEAPRA